MDGASPSTREFGVGVDAEGDGMIGPDVTISVRQATRG